MVCEREVIRSRTFSELPESGGNLASESAPCGGDLVEFSETSPLCLNVVPEFTEVMLTCKTACCTS